MLKLSESSVNTPSTDSPLTEAHEFHAIRMKVDELENEILQLKESILLMMERQVQMNERIVREFELLGTLSRETTSINNRTKRVLDAAQASIVDGDSTV